MNISEQIVNARQGQKMTQEELAVRLGVTSQAVSKWERGQGLPDAAMLADICTILGIDANDLLGVCGECRKTAAQPEDDENMMLNSCAEPILISFGEDFIPIFREGLKTDLISEKRRRIAREKGFVIPLVRIRDDLKLAHNEYEIYIYGKKKCGGSAENVTQELYAEIINEVFALDEAGYAALLNKQIVKKMTDSCEKLYPGIVEEVIPEQISYLECELVLKEILKRNGSIRNRIAIFEELEYQLLLTDLRSRCAQRQESVYAAAAEAILAKMNASAD